MSVRFTRVPLSQEVFPRSPASVVTGRQCEEKEDFPVILILSDFVFVVQFDCAMCSVDKIIQLQLRLELNCIAMLSRSLFSGHWVRK